VSVATASESQGAAAATNRRLSRVIVPHKPSRRALCYTAIIEMVKVFQGRQASPGPSGGSEGVSGEDVSPWPLRRKRRCFRGGRPPLALPAEAKVFQGRMRLRWPFRRKRRCFRGGCASPGPSGGSEGVSGEAGLPWPLRWKRRCFRGGCASPNPSVAQHRAAVGRLVCTREGQGGLALSGKLVFSGEQGRVREGLPALETLFSAVRWRSPPI
jgi:hypothetical protein